MAEALFSDAERERIAAAVAQAETRTSGEIVPFVVNRCGRYEVAVWKAAAVGAMGAAALALAVGAMYDGWGMGWLYTAWALALAVALGGGLQGTAGGLLAAFVVVACSSLWMSVIPIESSLSTPFVAASLIALGACLGVVGSWASLNRVLQAIG